MNSPKRRGVLQDLKLDSKVGEVKIAEESTLTNHLVGMAKDYLMGVMICVEWRNMELYGWWCGRDIYRRREPVLREKPTTDELQYSLEASRLDLLLETQPL